MNFWQYFRNLFSTTDPGLSLTAINRSGKKSAFEHMQLTRVTDG